MKNIWLGIKERIIRKLGGIPMWFFTPEELQRFHNRKMNEAIDKNYYDMFNNGFKFNPPKVNKLK